MELEKLIESLKDMEECCLKDEKCMVEEPVKMEKEEYTNTEIKEPEVDTAALDLLNKLKEALDSLDQADEMEIPTEEDPAGQKCLAEEHITNMERVFELDSAIADIENAQFKIRQQLEREPENTDLTQERDRLEPILKGLQALRDKEMYGESVMNELSDELVNKVTLERERNLRKEQDKLCAMDDEHVAELEQIENIAKAEKKLDKNKKLVAKRKARKDKKTK